MPQSKAKSRTDWTRVKREYDTNAPISHQTEDGPFDPNDAAAVAEYWRAAVIRRPGQRGSQKAATKERITIRLSPEVVQYFRSSGDGWQTRMDEILLAWTKRDKRKTG